MPGKCCYNPLWRQKSEFKAWLREDDGNPHKAHCLMCRKTFDVSNMGEAAVTSHGKSKKHCNLVKSLKDSASVSVKDFFSASTSSENCQRETPATVINAENIKSSCNLSSHITGNQVLSSEILWTLKVVDSHMSYNSCTGIAQLFNQMFPDSEIASKFACSEKKCAYLSCFGIAPYFKSVLIASLKQKSEFVLLFDESLNQKLQEKQMDYYIRIWENDRVITKYLDTNFLGHATAEIMLEQFSNCDSIKELPLGNMLQLSMDGPNVNWKFYGLLQTYLEENYASKVLNTGSCGLHIIHNAFKVGAEASGWRISKLLTSMFYHFKDSPARREDFLTITNCNNFPLKFCCHRWVENVSVAKRALINWPFILEYIKVIKNGKLKEPQNKSFEVLKEFSKDLLTPAKLSCFQSIAKLIDPFLVKYQSDVPMLPFLCDDFMRVLKSILSRFIKPEILNNCNSVFKHLNLNLSDIKIHLEYRKIDVGFSAEKMVQDLKKSEKISEKQFMQFKMEAKQFLLDTALKLMEKSPLRYIIIREMACLNPLKMKENKELCITKMKKILTVLVETKKIKEEKCDDVLLQFRNFLDVTSNNSFFQKFEEEKRIDSIFYEYLHEQSNFKDLWNVVKLLLLLSHGQASVERGFSINRQIEVENMKQKTYVAQRIITDHVRSVGGILNVSISKGLLLSAASARQKYYQYLDEQKRLKETEHQAKKRDLIHEEIEQLKKKRKYLVRDAEELIKSADDYALKAESTGKLTWIAKSNSMRITAKKKRGEITNVEMEMDIKLQELKNV